eukprot:scaffold2636_cov340-Pavlova_lutheri.AAC.128
MAVPDGLSLNGPATTMDAPGQTVRRNGKARRGKRSHPLVLNRALGRQEPIRQSSAGNVVRQVAPMTVRCAVCNGPKRISIGPRSLIDLRYVLCRLCSMDGSPIAPVGAFPLVLRTAWGSTRRARETVRALDRRDRVQLERMIRLPRGTRSTPPCRSLCANCRMWGEYDRARSGRWEEKVLMTAEEFLLPGPLAIRRKLNRRHLSSACFRHAQRSSEREAQVTAKDGPGTPRNQYGIPSRESSGPVGG